MTIRVLLFGHYKDFAPAGANHGAFSLDAAPETTVAGVARALGESDPRLSDLLARTRAAVNAEFADPARPLADGDEVAFLPPMSGG